MIKFIYQRDPEQFAQEIPPQTIEISADQEHMTLTQMLDLFTDFLRAIGYFVEPGEIVHEAKSEEEA